MIRPKSFAILAVLFGLVTVMANAKALRSALGGDESGPESSFISAVVYPANEESKDQANPADAEPYLSEGYVGRRVCGECHLENYSLHRKHGHASTFFATEATSLPDLFDKKEIEAGVEYGSYKYVKDKLGRLISSLIDDPEAGTLPLQYVLGSGHNAQTFLTLDVHDGKTRGIEHRISWYAGDKLDITVGHNKDAPENQTEKFGEISEGIPLERCIYCHTTTAQIEGTKVVDLMENVDCEKCHGPGAEHVAEARKSDTPPPYSVGRDSWDVESEIQLCGDCHRLPRSITLTELRDYPNTLVRFQPVGMLRSKCFLESDQGMRCSTCHNPHASAHSAKDQQAQIANCVSCHDQAEASHTVCPVSATSNCIECHMPEVEQSRGIKFHDHWIRIHDE